VGWFYGSWYPATVKALHAGGLVEVLWDGEHTRSYLEADHVQRQVPSADLAQVEIACGGAAPVGGSIAEGLAVAAKGGAEAGDVIASMRKVQTAWLDIERAIVEELGLPAERAAESLDCADDETVSSCGKDARISALAASTGSLQERVRSALDAAKRHFLRDTEMSIAIVKRIYIENGGVQIMQDRCSRYIHEKEEIVPVSELRFSHNIISDVFGNGPHAGQPLSSLVEALRTGTVKPRDLRLKAVRFAGRRHSLCNRRLFALGEYAASLENGLVEVPVKVLDLCPITAKFILAYSTCDEGLTVEVRSHH